MSLFFNSPENKNILLSGTFALPLLLGPTQTLVTGFSMGLVLAVSVMILGLVVFVLRPLISTSTRFVIYTILSASLLAFVELYLQASFYELHIQLGVYVPIISMSCLLYFLLDEKAMKLPAVSLFKVLVYFGLSCVCIFSLMSAMREFLSQGLLFKHGDLLFSRLDPINFHSLKFSLFSMFPGALFLLGFIIALKNVLSPVQESRE